MYIYNDDISFKDYSSDNDEYINNMLDKYVISLRDKGMLIHPSNVGPWFYKDLKTVNTLKIKGLVYSEQVIDVCLIICLYSLPIISA